MRPPTSSRATVITSDVRRRRRGAFTGPEGSWWLFLVPSAAVLGAVMLYPLGYAIYLSLFNYDLGSGSRDFIGFGNYAALLADDRFWHTLNRTVVIVSAAVGLEFCLGLLVAYGLYRLTFAVRTLNLLLFLPSIVTPVVAALFLRWIFIGRWGLLSGNSHRSRHLPAGFSRQSRLGARDCRAGRLLAVHPVHDPGAVRRTEHRRSKPDRGGADRRRRRLDIAVPHHAAGDPSADRIRAGDPSDGRVPLLRHDLRADLRRPGHRDRDDHAVHLRACVSPAADRQGVGTRRADACCSSRY